MTKKSTKKATTKKATKAPKATARAEVLSAPGRRRPPRRRRRSGRRRAGRPPRAPRATLTREFQGKEIKVEVLDAGSKCDGKTWRSLSAIAKAVSGTSWNGFLFFGLQARVAKAAFAKSEVQR